MTRIAIVASASLLSSLMLVAQPLQSPGAQQKSASSVVTITDQDNGRDIDLPAGGTLVVRLKSNPSAGYSWTIKGGPSPFRLVKSSTQKNGQTSHSAGSTGYAGFPADRRLGRHGVFDIGIPPAVGIHRQSCQDVQGQGQCALTQGQMGEPDTCGGLLWGGSAIGFPPMFACHKLL